MEEDDEEDELLLPSSPDVEEVEEVDEEGVGGRRLELPRVVFIVPIWSVYTVNLILVRNWGNNCNSVQ